MEGIPAGIEEDSFFNPNVRNVLIVDDLMSSSSKDSRVTEIFYEGSHHRNLSIIQISQNLYYSKDPTQRRNCHYVVLFKNPNDKQSIMTFARQMNPHKQKEFMWKYDTATERPHGYLLVDFKQSTKESDRLRPNVLDQMLGIKVQNTSNQVQSDESNRRDHINTSFDEQDIDNMPSCDDCGLVFDSIHDVLKHVKSWCPEKEGNGYIPSNAQLTKNGQTMHYNTHMEMSGPSVLEPPLKKKKIDKGSERKSFQHMRDELGSQWKDTLREDRKTYVDEGYTKRRANIMAINDNIKAIRKDLHYMYATLIDNWMRLTEDSAIHEKVMERAKFLHDTENLNWMDAAQQAIKEYKTLVNSYVMPELTDDESDEESDENQEEED